MIGHTRDTKGALMDVKFIEVINGSPGRRLNHGKMMLARWTAEEWAVPSLVAASAESPHPVVTSLLALTGKSPRHLWVCDLETREGLCITPGGSARADLEKHRIWHCPLFPNFLEWLYTQDLTDLSALPSVVELPDAPFALSGWRGPGRRRRR
jgi:hypothetical protein